MGFIILSIKSARLVLGSARAALFDWDGTIVNSVDYVPEIHASILAEMGLTLSVEIIKAHLGISQTALILMAAHENNRQLADEQTKNHLIPTFVSREDAILDEYYADGRINLRPGIIDLLQYLRQRNVPTAIVSNA